MKKYLILLASLFLAGFSVAWAEESSGRGTTFDDARMPGLVTEALPLQEGMLLLGVAQNEVSGWMARIGPEGEIHWVLQEEGGGTFRCARLLSDGRVSVLVRREPDFEERTGEYTSHLAFVSPEGRIMRTRKLSAHTEWLVPVKDGYFALGTYDPGSGDTGEGAQGLVVRLDMKGERQWSTRFPTVPYAGMTFQKGVLDGDAIIVIGEGILDDGSRLGLLHRLDLRGNIRWTRELNLGEDTYMGDVSITRGGRIAASASGWTYEEDSPGTRVGWILGYTMKGEKLWEYQLDGYQAADYVLSTADGILVGSRGLNLENSPLLGGSWYMRLGEEGSVLEALSFPDIGENRLEMMGVALDAAGEPWLLGATLEEPGFLGLPFVGRANSLPARLPDEALQISDDERIEGG